MKFMSRSSHAPEEVSTASGNRDTQWIVDSGAVSQRNIIIDGVCLLPVFATNYSLLLNSIIAVWKFLKIVGSFDQHPSLTSESYMKLEDLCEIGRITSKQFNPYIEKILAEKK